MSCVQNKTHHWQRHRMTFLWSVTQKHTTVTAFKQRAWHVQTSSSKGESLCRRFILHIVVVNHSSSSWSWAHRCRAPDHVAHTQFYITQSADSQRRFFKTINWSWSCVCGQTGQELSISRSLNNKRRKGFAHVRSLKCRNIPTPLSYNRSKNSRNTPTVQQLLMFL